MSQQDRLQDMLQELVAAAIERVIVQGDALVYYAEWTYIVETVSAGPPVTYDLRATDPRLPDLQGIQLWQTAGGAVAQAVTGTVARVKFLNADRTKPVVCGFDTNTVASTAIAGGGPAVARVGDSVAIQSNITDSGGNTITPAQFAMAMPYISSGSPKVTSG